MPLYEYECKECRNRVEVLHGLDEQGPNRCEKCGGELRRLLGVPGLIFKGSGFYVNDYARKDTAGKRTKGSKGRTDSNRGSETSEAARGTVGEHKSTSQNGTQPQQEREGT